MPLKTDYKNFIPSTTTKIFDIKQASDDTVINADVKFEDVTVYSQEGDPFGAADINATNTQVNVNTDAVALKAPLANPTFTGLITTAGQVAFPATQNPSADPNTLDDYEEGTFTPIISGSTIAGVGTYTKQVGQYQKIGNTVNILIDVGWSAHTGTGNLALSGLPFNPTNDSPLAWAISNLTLSANNIFTARCGGGTNTVTLRQIATGVGTVASIPMDTAVDYIILSGSYFV